MYVKPVGNLPTSEWIYPNKAPGITTGFLESKDDQSGNMQLIRDGLQQRNNILSALANRGAKAEVG